VRSPEDFGKGLARGTTSLVKNSVYGIFNTASKISGSLGKGLATLAMDETYIREREKRTRHKSKWIGEGIALGMRDLGVDLYNGVTGVVKEPVIGVMNEGFSGFLKGTKKAALGLTIKPVVGLIDLATRTTQAISRRTSTFDSFTRKRFRPPRYIGADRIIEPYSFEKSLGQTLLHMVDSGKFENEWYLFHYVIHDDVLIVSDKHILLVTAIGASISSKWNFLLKSVGKVDKGIDSMTFYLRSGRKYMIESIEPQQLSAMHQNIIDILLSIDKRITIY